MGIHDFFPSIEKSATALKTDAWMDVKFEDLKDQKVAVDTNGAMYLLSAYQNDLAALANFVTLCIEFEENNIKPIFVFDGSPPTEKEEETKKRKKAKDDHFKKVAELQAQLTSFIEKIEKEKLAAPDEVSRSILDGHIRDKKLEFDKQKGSAVYVSEDLKDKIWSLLVNLGYKCIRAHGEGESLCAMLCRFKMVDLVISKDSDTLVCGAPKLLTNLQGKLNRKSVSMKLYNLTKIYSLFKIKKQEELIEICCLLPNDFNQKHRLPGFGMATAIKQLAVHKTIEGIIVNKLSDQKKKFQLDLHYDPNRIRKQFYFYAFGHLPDYVNETIKCWEKINEKKIKMQIYELINTYKSKDGAQNLYYELRKFYLAKFKSVMTFDEIDGNYENGKLEKTMPSPPKIPLAEQEKYDELIAKKILQFRLSKESTEIFEYYNNEIQPKLLNADFADFVPDEFDIAEIPEDVNNNQVQVPKLIIEEVSRTAKKIKVSISSSIFDSEETEDEKIENLKSEIDEELDNISKMDSFEDKL